MLSYIPLKMPLPALNELNVVQHSLELDWQRHQPR
jgi:hypothetical protein